MKLKDIKEELWIKSKERYYWIPIYAELDPKSFNVSDFPDDIPTAKRAIYEYVGAVSENYSLYELIKIE